MRDAHALGDMNVLGVRRRVRVLSTTNAPSVGCGLVQQTNDFLVGVVHWRQTTLAGHQMSHFLP